MSLCLNQPCESINHDSVWLDLTYFNAQRSAPQMLAVDALCLTNIRTILISLSDSYSVEADPKIS